VYDFKFSPVVLLVMIEPPEVTNHQILSWTLFELGAPPMNRLDPNTEPEMLSKNAANDAVMFIS
jgi:hypothetical protein